MSATKVEHHDVVNALSGVVALCDVTLSQLGNRAKSRKPLLMIREAAQRLLARPAMGKPHEEDQVHHEGTVLIMENDELSLLTLEHQLRSLGLLVLAAQSPEMADKLVKLVKGRIDLLFWGLHGDEEMLEPTPGCEACERLRVAYVTDDPRPEFDESVERPIDPRELERVLARILR